MWRAKAIFPDYSIWEKIFLTSLKISKSCNYFCVLFQIDHITFLLYILFTILSVFVSAVFVSEDPEGAPAALQNLAAACRIFFF